MKKLLLLAVMLTSLEALADPKRFLCEATYKDINGAPDERQVEAILDTEDFSKENPKADVTLLKWTIDGEAPERINAAIGITYSLDYRVTPTTITIKYRGSKDSAYTYKIDISRKDLTFKNGKCSIEDYSVDNAI